MSWSFCKPVTSRKDIEHCLLHHAEVIRYLSETRFPCYFLAGVHPRNISPDLKPEHIRETIFPYLDDPLCIGIGEIGLETGSRQEVDILLAHLDLAEEAAARGKVIGIHTPRSNKAGVTEQTLELLQPYKEFCERVVIDHCTPQIIGDVLTAGFWAGVTLSSVKVSAGDVFNIIDNQDKCLKRIMLNTDSGTRFYEDLFQFVQASDTDISIKKDLTCSNAERFFGIGNKG